jgi:hypothetical protein
MYLSIFLCVARAAPRHAASISTTGKSYVEVFDARMSWIANQVLNPGFSS